MQSANVAFKGKSWHMKGIWGQLQVRLWEDNKHWLPTKRDPDFNFLFLFIAKILPHCCSGVINKPIADPPALGPFRHFPLSLSLRAFMSAPPSGAAAAIQVGPLKRSQDIHGRKAVSEVARGAPEFFIFPWTRRPATLKTGVRNPRK